MKIVYASCSSSKSTFYKLFNESQTMPGQQVQKYHRLLMEGMIKNNATVISLTALPINKENCTKKIIRLSDEVENGILYKYIPIINLKYIKNLIIFLNSFISTMRIFSKDKSSVLFCDVLNISVSSGALLASKIKKNRSVGIVTDLPDHLTNNKSSIITKFNNYIMNKFDSYIFLTEYMNQRINKKHSPYIVIEGHADINMIECDNNPSNKYEKKVCIYAGGIHKRYGIKNLTEAFIEANIENSELHIYGNGDYEQELLDICKWNESIKYFGVKANDYILKEQLKATLLINPRPTGEEFTKYSFPSKNLEYMASGTPVLTTLLPGMPIEYYDYVYLIQDDNITGIKKSLTEVLELSPEILHEKGGKAKMFVINEKNNKIQAKKIFSLLEG